MLPSFENFTALPTTFKIVCISRFSSPMAYSGKSGAKFKVTGNFLTDAIGLIKLRTCNGEISIIFTNPNPTKVL
jgi:hypothetical protein